MRTPFVISLSIVSCVLATAVVDVARAQKATPCAADSLSRKKIAAKDLTEAGNGKAADAPDELVAVLSPSGAFTYTCARFSLDGKLLILGTSDGRISVFDLAKNKASDFPAHKGRVWDIQIGTKTYATAGADGKVHVRLVTGAGAPLTFNDKAGDYCTLSYHPDGKFLAMSSSGSRSGILRLHNITNLAKEVTLKDREFKVSAAAISPDGKSLVAGSWEGNEGRVRFWDTKTGEQTLALDQPGRPAHTLVFRPDGSQLASVHDYRNFIQLWNPVTGQKIRTLEGHKAVAEWIAFNPAGTALASCGADRTIRLWDPDAGNETKSILLGPKEGLKRIAFSPEGRHLAVVSAKGSVYIVRLMAD